MKARDIYIIGGLAVVGIWFVRNQVKAAADALLSAPGEFGSKIGLTLYDWVNPNTTGEMLYYVATFPDGAGHAVPSTTVNTAGQFVYQGARYALKLDKAGKRYAVRA